MTESFKPAERLPTPPLGGEYLGEKGVPGAEINAVQLRRPPAFHLLKPPHMFCCFNPFTARGNSKKRIFFTLPLLCQIHPNRILPWK
ncbi:hypothetical protein FKM82_020993 [Ascaphus truei]